MLVEESARLQGRSLKLTDILLLILRCLVIILLAIVLSKPIYKQQLTVTEEKGWLLIQEQDVKDAYKLHQPLIDSLTTAGYQFHYFDKGFAQGDLSNALLNADTLDREQEADYWVLLKQLNEVVPPDLPIHVFARNSLTRFNGQRPQLSMLLTWHGFALADTSNPIVALAYKMHNDSIRVLSASNSHKALSFQRETVAGEGNSKYTFVNNEVTTRSGKTGKPLQIDTSGLQVKIFSDQYVADANYLKAAIEAIQTFTQRDISVSIVNKVAGLKTNPDWIFWLSEQPLPAEASAKHIFQYAKGKVQAVEAWIRVTGNAKIDEEPIELSRRIQVANADDNHTTIWTDGFGTPILTREKKNYDLYHFYSRFNPVWNEIPWSPHFAEMIFQLVMPSGDIDNELDKRSISDLQAQPVMSKNQNRFDKEKFIKKCDLSKYIWLMAFLFFIVERYLSLKNNTVHA